MEEVEAKFQTDLPVPFRIPSSSYSLPISTTPTGLQQLVSQQTGQSQPLIFTLNNTLLTGSLQEHMTQLHLSAETLLEIWYSLALPMPQTTSSIPCPDWISGCEFVGEGEVAVTDYAGNLMICRDAEIVLTEALHPYPIKALAVTGERGGLIGTGGKDGTLKVSGYTQGEFELKAEGKLGSIEVLAWSPSGAMIAAGLFSGEVHISSINLEESAMLTKASKRQKLHGFSLHSQHLSLPHSDSLTGLLWPELEILYTSAQDHSVVVWDISREAGVFTYTAPRAIQSFAVAGKMIACGLENGLIKVVDERSSQVIATLTSASWIRTLKWHNNCLLSGDEAGDLKIWDIRTTSPLATERKHSDKILALASQGNLSVTGGADCSLQFHSFQP